MHPDFHNRHRRHSKPKPYDQEQDKPTSESAPAPVPELDRFILVTDEDHPDVYIVRDDLTGRIRDVTKDLAFAQAVADHLNAGLVYDGELIAA